MIRINPRLRRFSIAAAMLVVAAPPALAEPAPIPPPAGPSPQPVPYPGDPQPPPKCTNRFCIPQSGGVGEHKHIAGVKYEDIAAGGQASAAPMESASLNLNVEEVTWGKIEGAGPVSSADPMEGGQIAARYRPGRQKQGKITAVNVASDPEEGGQIAASTSGLNTGRPAGYIPEGSGLGTGRPAGYTPEGSGLNTGRPAGSSPEGSGLNTGREPGKLEVPNMDAAGTAGTSAKVTATFKTLAGKCATGAHFKQVTITARSGGYTLHDATVISVTPADAVDGRAMEEVTVSYASLGE